jgi:hypothetical protein
MTDKSKYSNVTVDNQTYAIITKLQTKLIPEVTLSRSQVIKTIVQEKARTRNNNVELHNVVLSPAESGNGNCNL